MRFALFSILWLLGTLTIIVAKSLQVTGWPYKSIMFVTILVTSISGALLKIDHDKSKK